MNTKINYIERIEKSEIIADTNLIDNPGLSIVGEIVQRYIDKDEAHDFVTRKHLFAIDLGEQVSVKKMRISTAAKISSHEITGPFRDMESVYKMLDVEKP